MRSSILLATLCVMSACGEATPVEDAGGPSDGGAGDAGPSDGGAGDGGVGDGGVSDGGVSDGGVNDGGPSDGGSSDGGVSDGGTPSQGSCDSRPAMTVCTEHVSGYDVSLLSILESTCTSMGGTWSSGPCPRTGAVGGCLLSGGTATDIQWVYSGDASFHMSNCASGGGTWITP